MYQIGIRLRTDRQPIREPSNLNSWPEKSLAVSIMEPLASSLILFFWRFLKNALPMDDRLRYMGFQMTYQFHFCIRSQQDSLLHLFCQGEIAS
ncbi:hypothetical protein QVD17_37517 [Tagetes erecta]|uniref:Reverse transcriptase zinc-binding domain-containing protein n=1 Tax=Tagetes erecta TaxID=13708 RepID=A0AAD8NIF1_TARER|nr:hypothetical protein QVD17_37517 [Tagetes erecta]